MKFESIIDDFGQNALLGLMETEALRLIAFSTDLRNLAPGDVLFKAGEVADGAWFIHAGTMSVRAGADVASYGPGALLGENALIVESTRPATATAEDEVEIRYVPRALMRKVLSEFPDSAAAAQVYLAERANAIRAKLATLHALLPDA
jgi:CRP-like cAMP-binding protein